MKIFSLALLVFLISIAGQAEEIRSAKSHVNIARVVKVINLVATSEIQVNVAVQDLGGSTDLSPTQVVYLTLYADGEMFSTDATFEIGSVFSVKSAKRIKGGIYEIAVWGQAGERGYGEVTYLIDARKAIVEMKNVNCGGDFDCDAAENFSSTVSVVRK